MSFKGRAKINFKNILAWHARHNSTDKSFLYRRAEEGSTGQSGVAVRRRRQVCDAGPAKLSERGVSAGFRKANCLA